MLQVALTLALFVIIIFPLGTYIYHIATNKKTFADPVFDRVDDGIFIPALHPPNQEKITIHSGKGAANNFVQPYLFLPSAIALL